MLSAINKHLKYTAKFVITAGSKLFSTTSNYVVKNVSMGPTSFSPDKPLIATIITLVKDGKEELIKSVAMIPTGTYGLYSFHNNFMGKLIETQEANPSATVTGTVIDHMQRIVYEVVKGNEASNNFVGNSPSLNNFDDW